jgi:hypothetical protein
MERFGAMREAIFTGAGGGGGGGGAGGGIFGALMHILGSSPQGLVFLGFLFELQELDHGVLTTPNPNLAVGH